MSSNLKNQVYNLTIKIHEINISVKFPCSVSTSIKVDGRDTEINKDFKLLNGNATVQQTISADLKIIYNCKTKIFTETKICIMVYLKSSSGRIPAGNATIPIKSDRQHQHTKIGIQKCPDKTASILYSLKFVKVKQQDYLQESIHSRSTQNLLEINNMPITNQIRYSDSRSISRKQNFKSQLYSSKVTANQSPSVLFNRIITQNNSEREKSQAGSQISQSQSRISKLIMKQHQNQVASQRQRIIDLQKQKVRAMKQIRQLKHQIQTNSLRNSTVTINYDQAITTKQQIKINNLQDEVQKQRNKVSQYQTQSHKRKLRIQQLQRDIKIIQKKNEQMQQQLKKQVQQKQQLNIKNKEIQLQFRQLKQKYQDQLLMYQNFVKRAEFKQNVYKQQLKNINDKYTASQSQKQKLLFQKNQIVSEQEQKDKKQKDNFRNRERIANQQKNKLIRRIDALEKQLNAKQEEKDFAQTQISQFEIERKKNKGIIQAQQTQIQQLQRQLQDMRISLDKEILNAKSLEAELLKTDKFDQQRKNFKKIFYQKQQQIALANKNKQSLQNIKKTLTQKTQQLQSQLKQKNASLKTIQKQFQTLNKKYETLKKSQQQKAKQISDITFIKQNQQSKVFGLNEELKQMQKKFKIRQMELNRQKENNKNKLYQLQEQNHELNQKCYAMNQQLFQADKSINQLKSAYQLKLSDIDKFQTLINQKQQYIKQLQTQMIQLQQSKGQSQQNNLVKTTKLNKKIKQLESQNNQYQNIIQRNNKINEQNMNKIITQLKTCQIEAKNKEKQIYQLRRIRDQSQSQFSILTSEIEKLTLQSRQKTKQNHNLRQQIQTIIQQNQQLTQKLQQVQFQLQNSKNQAKILQQNLQGNLKQKQGAGNQAKKWKKQLQKYKSNNLYFIKTFFNLMMQNDIPDVLNITHEDTELVKSMIQVLKKKKAIKQQYQQHIQQLNNFNTELNRQISELNEQINHQGQEIHKLNKIIQDLQKAKLSFEKQSQKIKNTIQQKLALKDKNINELQNHIAALQQSENNLGIVLKQKTDQLQQLNQQIIHEKEIQEMLYKKLQLHTATSNKQLQKFYQNTNSIIDDLKAQLEVVKVKLQKQQTNRKIIAIQDQKHKAEINELKDQLAEQKNINKNLNEDIIGYKKQIKQLNEIIKEKDEQIVQYQTNYNSISHQIQQNNCQFRALSQKNVNLDIVNRRLNQKCGQLQQKIKNCTDVLKQKQKIFEQQNKKCQKQVKKLQKQLQLQKKTKLNLQIKINEYENKINDSQIQLKQATKQLENMRKKINLISTQSTGERQKYLKQQENIVKRLQQTVKQKQKIIDNLQPQLQQLKNQRHFLSNNCSNLQKTIQQNMLSYKKASDEANKKYTILQKQNITTTQQLTSTKTQLKTVQSNLTQLSRSFENYQLQNNTNVQHLQPISQKLNILLSDTGQYIKFMNQFQASKAKLIKIGNYKLETNNYSCNIGEIVREINIAAQRCKLQIINKAKIPQEDKNAIVEQFKTLQGSIQKIIRF